MGILWHSTLSAFHYYGLTGYMYNERRLDLIVRYALVLTD